MAKMKNEEIKNILLNSKKVELEVPRACPWINGSLPIRAASKARYFQVPWNCSCLSTAMGKKILLLLSSFIFILQTGCSLPETKGK
jgi:hypothetical protein